MGDYSCIALGVMRSESEIQWLPIAVGHLGFGFLLVIIYSRQATISTFATGATAGAVIGFLVASGLSFPFLTKLKFSSVVPVWANGVIVIEQIIPSKLDLDFNYTKHLWYGGRSEHPRCER